MHSGSWLCIFTRLLQEGGRRSQFDALQEAAQTAGADVVSFNATLGICRQASRWQEALRIPHKGQGKQLQMRVASCPVSCRIFEQLCEEFSPTLATYKAVFVARNSLAQCFFCCRPSLEPVPTLEAGPMPWRTCKRCRISCHPTPCVP